MSTDSSLVQRLATLGDLVRLRILRLLNRDELSVGELSRALQLPQSTVSRHLKLLHSGQWIVKRSEGTASLYRLVEEDLTTEARALWHLARAQVGTTPVLADDDRRATEVIAERATDSQSYFGRLGGEWDEVRSHLFGGSFTAEALVTLLGSELVVADLGCGTGQAAELLAPAVRKLIAVDREPGMLAAARKRLRSLADRVDFVEGDLLDLPLETASVDAAMILLVLHHVDDPIRAVCEAARILRPAGRLMLVDMLTHDRSNYRHTMGHQHLGFDENQVRQWAEAAEMTLTHFHPLRPDTAAKGPGLFAAILARRANT